MTVVSRPGNNAEFIARWHAWLRGSKRRKWCTKSCLGPYDPQRLPAQLIAPEGKLLWMMDEAASTLVPHPERRRSA